MTTKLIIIIIVLSIGLSSALTALAFSNVYSDEISEAKAQEDLRERLYEWETRTNDYGGVDESWQDIGQMKKDCVYAETSGYLEWCKSKGLR